ncbi:hypothetical protein NL676_022660 [Syzygium grande]|nr:hypothetical protein NL676_022660 [Syzygium grande]
MQAKGAWDVAAATGNRQGSLGIRCAIGQTRGPLTWRPVAAVGAAVVGAGGTFDPTGGKPVDRRAPPDAENWDPP